MIRLAKKTVRRALNALPDWPAVDRIEALAAFWVAHKRLPRRGSGLYNDRLYFFKTDPDWMENPIRKFCTDKALAKIHILDVLGWDAAPRTLALIERPEDVVEAAFPAPCIIKPAHLQGEFIQHDGSAPLGEERLRQIRGWFGQRFYRSRMRERNYRGLTPKVIAEELVGDPYSITDWRFVCWQGRVRFVMQFSHEPHMKSYFTRDWEFLDIKFADAGIAPQPRPPQFDKMLEIAEKLASGFDFIRVDLYATADRVWVGELTNVPHSANGRFRSKADERRCHDLVFGGALFSGR